MQTKKDLKMTIKDKLNGVFTALITPFNTDGSIDWKAFDALIERQLEAGIHGLVPVGTTGEAATLSDNEAIKIIERTVELAKGKAYILAGTGSNSTEKTINATKRAADAGVDGVLLVTPYYNKPSQVGLISHYEAVADCAEVDNILYSVPGRCGIAIDISTAAHLSRSRTNIIAIKEAGGAPERVTELRANCDPAFAVHCGDDGLALAFYTLGATGLTSVLSNYEPAVCLALYNAWQNGNHERALQIHEDIFQLANDLFIENSPAPVKYAISMQGYINNIVRQPLATLQPGSTAVLEKTIKTFLEKKVI